MRKIRRVCMTLALAVLLAGMTACGNNTTNDTGNGNTNTESDMGQTDNRNDVHTTEMPSNDNVNDVTEAPMGMPTVRTVQIPGIEIPLEMMSATPLKM